MAILSKRSEFTDNAQAKASSGWQSCMSKPMCKWPAILGILLAIILLLTLTYFFLRCLSCCCCDCLSGGRYRRAGGKRKQYKYADLHSSPYHANPAYRSGGNDAPPPPGYAVGQPPQYAAFENSARGGRGDDGLPAMPTWGEGKEKRAYDHGEHGVGARMGKSESEKEFEQRAPMLGPDNAKVRGPVPGYGEMDGGQGGDLGQYRPYGQAYTAYSPVVGGAGQPPGNSWRNV